jgi:hypothetical protein
MITNLCSNKIAYVRAILKPLFRTSSNKLLLLLLLLFFIQYLLGSYNVKPIEQFLMLYRKYNHHKFTNLENSFAIFYISSCEAPMQK